MTTPQQSTLTDQDFIQRWFDMMEPWLVSQYTKGKVQWHLLLVGPDEKIPVIGSGPVPPGYIEHAAGSSWIVLHDDKSVECWVVLRRRGCEFCVEDMLAHEVAHVVWYLRKFEKARNFREMTTIIRLDGGNTQHDDYWAICYGMVLREGHKALTGNTW